MGCFNPLEGTEACITDKHTVTSVSVVSTWSQCAACGSGKGSEMLAWPGLFNVSFQPPNLCLALPILSLSVDLRICPRIPINFCFKYADTIVLQKRGLRILKTVI